MAPDATALGQIYWYTVESSAGNPVDPQRLWSINRFYIAPQLNAARGVADVATVGGAPLEYQVDVRPEALRAFGITLGDLYSAIARSNMPSGGGVIQKNKAEYIVRGVGWIRDKRDIERTVIREVNGVPIYVDTVATVQLGTQFRRSVFEKNGSEVVGGVVLMRHGENPLTVTERVREKIQKLQPGLPAGVHIVPAYDRTRLIHGAIHTLTEVMWHEMLIASIAILLILSHIRSVFVICVTLPLAVLFSFLMMWVLRTLGIIDIQANIMSLAGITISIGILVDQAIVMTENATHALKEHFGSQHVTGDTRELVIPACRTVSPAGLHQKLRLDRRGADFGHARTGPHSHLHSGTSAERRRQLDCPQLHSYLQTAADVGAAAAEPGDVVLCRAADFGVGYVSPAGDHWPGGLGGRLEIGLSDRLCRRGVIDRRRDAGLALADAVLRHAHGDRAVGLPLSKDRRCLHAGARRRNDARYAGDGAAGERDSGGR
ncbi:MAG: hypothetical protein B7Z55_02085 [Planctomycetales bacterium 12-60-4]|nr:MAG: hypothetical protein B7Z55_02085 [Planctomycetales bacterium 12-60-4]